MKNEKGIEFETEKFTEIINEFYKAKKRILQNRPISTKKTKQFEYVNLLIETYNSIIDYARTTSENLTLHTKKQIFSKIRHCRELLVRCFGKLNCRIKVPENIESFEFVNKDVVTDDESESEYSESEIESRSDREYNLKTENKMATMEVKKSYIGMCASIIRDNYDGNPLTLESFLDKIELLQELTESNLEKTFFSFIKSKLESKAREILPENISTVADIKIALVNGIKHDNSKVIAGKIAALSVKNNNFSDFAKQAEELADALKRSLVVEGITKKKAQEMAIEQTVSVCRLNARSDLVKSILASSTFSDPKEVVAKLVVEQTTESKEQQVLSIRTHARGRSNDFRSRNNSYRGNNFNRYRNHSYRGNNRGNGNSQNYQRTNNNPNNNRYFQNNYRGNSGNRSSQGYNQRASVRTLNSEAPQQSVLREQEEN